MKKGKIIFLLPILLLFSCVDKKESVKIKVEVCFKDNTKDTLSVYDNYTISSYNELYHWIEGMSSVRIVATNVKYVKELSNE